MLTVKVLSLFLALLLLARSMTHERKRERGMGAADSALVYEIQKHGVTPQWIRS
jgi:hypothetical protein